MSRFALPSPYKESLKINFIFVQSFIDEIDVIFVSLINLLNVIVAANTTLTCEQTTQFSCIKNVKK